MGENKPKEGVSIKEIEEFTKKHRLEVFLCVAFILACLFSFIMWGTGMAILGSAIGAVVGILLPLKVERGSRSAFAFIFKQESTTQLILGIVFLVLAIFLPPLYFLVLGCHGGKCIRQIAAESFNHQGPNPPLA